MRKGIIIQEAEINLNYLAIGPEKQSSFSSTRYVMANLQIYSRNVFI